MRSNILLGFIVSLAWLLSGCVTHAPISDSFIFQDADIQRSSDRQARLGLVLNHGLSYDLAPKASDTKWPRFESPLSPLNPKQRSVGLYVLSYDKAKKSSFALTLGTFSAGLDITFKLFGRNYITGVECLQKTEPMIKLVLHTTQQHNEEKEVFS